MATTIGKARRRELAERMLAYFGGYDDDGAPSFGKFARGEGLGWQEMALLRSHEDFETAYRTCSEIRRDYLLDKALCRRADPSLVKFILESEARAERAAEGEGDGELRVLVEVV